MNLPYYYKARRMPTRWSLRPDNVAETASDDSDIGSTSPSESDAESESDILEFAAPDQYILQLPARTTKYFSSKSATIATQRSPGTKQKLFDAVCFLPAYAWRYVLEVLHLPLHQILWRLVWGYAIILTIWFALYEVEHLHFIGPTVRQTRLRLLSEVRSFAQYLFCQFLAPPYWLSQSFLPITICAAWIPSSPAIYRNTVSAAPLLASLNHTINNISEFGDESVALLPTIVQADAFHHELISVSDTIRDSRLALKDKIAFEYDVLMWGYQDLTEVLISIYKTTRHMISNTEVHLSESSRMMMGIIQRAEAPQAMPDLGILSSIFGVSSIACSVAVFHLSLSPMMKAACTASIGVSFQTRCIRDVAGESGEGTKMCRDLFLCAPIRHVISNLLPKVID